MPRLSRRSELATIASTLGVRGELYHVHVPHPPREPYGPGWYLANGNGRATYLGFTNVMACMRLHELAAREAVRR
jgi:hypothetical protein